MTENQDRVEGVIPRGPSFLVTFHDLSSIKIEKASIKSRAGDD